MSSNELAAGSRLAAESPSTNRCDVAILVPCYNKERAIAKVASGVFGIALIIISIGLAIPIVITCVQEGIVPRLPTAVLPTGLTALAFQVDRLRLDSGCGHARPA